MLRISQCGASGLHHRSHVVVTQGLPFRHTANGTISRLLTERPNHGVHHNRICLRVGVYVGCICIRAASGLIAIDLLSVEHRERIHADGLTETAAQIISRNTAGKLLRSQSIYGVNIVKVSTIGYTRNAFVQIVAPFNIAVRHGSFDRTNHCTYLGDTGNKAKVIAIAQNSIRGHISIISCSAANQSTNEAITINASLVIAIHDGTGIGPEDGINNKASIAISG